MAKVILICGKIASGKSCFADKLKKENNAVILSCDELFKMIFKDDQGEKHDEITKRIREYIYKKSVEIVRAGTDVILEFGFWSRENRKCVSE
jgi:predicted kinase